MQDPKSKILEYQRLRPQKKGKLPNFTNNFEAYSQQIDQILKNKVQISFNLNKFGSQKKYKLINLLKKPPEDNKISQSLISNSKLSVSNIIGCDKFLKYNQTIISPNHKIKIHNKSLKKLKKQQSTPSFMRLKESDSKKSQKKQSKLPKITLTAREKSQQKGFSFNKENLFDNKTARIHNRQLFGEKNQSYVRLYHIVTMGRKQVND